MKSLLAFREIGSPLPEQWLLLENYIKKIKIVKTIFYTQNNQLRVIRIQDKINSSWIRIIGLDPKAQSFD